MTTSQSMNEFLKSAYDKQCENERRLKRERRELRKIRKGKLDDNEGYQVRN